MSTKVKLMTLNKLTWEEVPWLSLYIIVFLVIFDVFSLVFFDFQDEQKRPINHTRPAHSFEMGRVKVSRQKPIKPLGHVTRPKAE